MKVDLGEKVQEGQLLAVVHDHQRTGTEPVPYHSQLDGILTARHIPGLIGMGGYPCRRRHRNRFSLSFILQDVLR